MKKSKKHSSDADIQIVKLQPAGTLTAGTQPAGTQPEDSEKPSAKEKLGNLKGGLLTLWQLVKFSIVGMIGGVIQTILQYVLPIFFDPIKATLPSWLGFLYNESTMFDTSTAAGAADAAKYIINGTVTWGYVLPFFLANIAANIFCYIENKKRTFKSHAPQWHFTVYFIIMVLTIVAMTWLQGVIYPWLIHFDSSFIHTFARLLCLAPVGLIQTIVFFITQKILLPPDPDPADLAKKEAEEDAAILKDVTPKAVEEADRKLDELLKQSDDQYVI